MEDLILNTAAVEVCPDICNFKYGVHLKDQLRYCETLMLAANDLYKRESGSQPAQNAIIDWLQDNFYLIQRTNHQIQKTLRGRFRNLPRSELPFVGCPQFVPWLVM
jgi:hypothetical protein